jgi:membrane-associated phospholipid phosphatase
MYNLIDVIVWFLVGMFAGWLLDKLLPILIKIPSEIRAAKDYWRNGKS